MKLYMIIADMSTDENFVDIGLVGVFTDRDNARKVFLECPYKEKVFQEIESDTIYGTMEKRSANKVGFGFSMITGSEITLDVVE